MKRLKLLFKSLTKREIPESYRGSMKEISAYRQGFITGFFKLPVKESIVIAYPIGLIKGTSARVYLAVQKQNTKSN